MKGSQSTRARCGVRLEEKEYPAACKEMRTHPSVPGIVKSVSAHLNDTRLAVYWAMRKVLR